MCSCVLPFHSIQFHNLFTNTIVLSLHLATLYIHHLPGILEIRKWYELHNCVEEKDAFECKQAVMPQYQQIH